MRRAFVVLLGVTLAFVSTLEVRAQSKKKGKESELAICKRGKLIFEDDFSGKELEWNAASGDWKIDRKALVTRSKGTVEEKNYPSIFRPFLDVPDVLFEFRTIVPLKGNVGVYGKHAGSDAENPGAHLFPGRRLMSITYWAPTRVDLAIRPFIYEKPRWLDVIFELCAGRCALTVDGKTIRGEVPLSAATQRSAFSVSVINPNGELFAIDDVKVYEALPKDEAKDNDMKGKKKK